MMMMTNMNDDEYRSTTSSEMVSKIDPTTRLKEKKEHFGRIMVLA